MTDNPTTNPPNHKQATKTQNEDARARRERWMVWFTGIVAVVGAIQAVSSYLQWDTMRRALDANERAWVIPSSPSLLILEAYQLIKLNAIMKNYGKSPAFDVTLRWQSTFSISPAPPEPQRSTGASKTPMTPGETGTVEINLPAFSTSDTADIKAGTKNWFLLGEVIYSDPFATSPALASDTFPRMAIGLPATCKLTANQIANNT